MRVRPAPNHTQLEHVRFGYIVVRPAPNRTQAGTLNRNIHDVVWNRKSGKTQSDHTSFGLVYCLLQATPSISFPAYSPCSSWKSMAELQLGATMCLLPSSAQRCIRPNLQSSHRSSPPYVGCSSNAPTTSGRFGVQAPGPTSRTPKILFKRIPNASQDDPTWTRSGASQMQLKRTVLQYSTYRVNRRQVFTTFLLE